MNSYQCENIQGDYELTHAIQENDEHDSTSNLDNNVENRTTDYRLASETLEGTPRSHRSRASSNETYASLIPKKDLRSKSSKPASPKTLGKLGPIQQLSSIPLPVKFSGTVKVSPPVKCGRTSSRTSSTIGGCRTSTAVANKHTLEIQFINKNKRYQQLKKELLEKQKPVVDLYQSLVQIKKKLEELGKNVKLEDIRFMSYDAQKKPDMGAGEEISMEVVEGMKSSIEEIPKTLMDICKNLLSRRALIVELLESVTKAEVDVAEVSDKIESLKNEGQQLQHSLDAVINEHQAKISALVGNWQKLLNEKQSNTTDTKIEDLEKKLEHQEKLAEESTNVIHDLYKQMEDRKASYEKSITELNGVIESLKEQMKKVQVELTDERKSNTEFRNRNNSCAQTMKSMKARISELETEKRATETDNAEMQKKIRLLQEQIKVKEATWNQEKEELNKNLKHQENLLQKLTADKNQFETRLILDLTLRAFAELLFPLQIAYY